MRSLNMCIYKLYSQSQKAVYNNHLSLSTQVIDEQVVILLAQQSMSWSSAKGINYCYFQLESEEIIMLKEASHQR